MSNISLLDLHLMLVGSMIYRVPIETKTTECLVYVKHFLIGEENDLGKLA